MTPKPSAASPISARPWGQHPARKNRKGRYIFNTWLDRQRNLVESFFNKLKNYRVIATRYDRNSKKSLAPIKMIALRITIKI
jgi:transposase